MERLVHRVIYQCECSECGREILDWTGLRLEHSTGPPKPECPRAEPRTEPVRSENIDLSVGAGSGRVQLPSGEGRVGSKLPRVSFGAVRSAITRRIREDPSFK